MKTRDSGIPPESYWKTFFNPSEILTTLGLHCAKGPVVDIGPVQAIRYRRERWVTPDGQTLIAQLPGGIAGHFGPELRRLVLMLYHQGQSTDSKRCHGVTIIGPVAADTSWQARVEGGLTKPAFQVDWERRVATCPAGHESVSWLPAARPNEGMAFEVRFGRKDCTPCPLRPHCTRAKRQPRIIWLQERERFEALQGARRHRG